MNRTPAPAHAGIVRWKIVFAVALMAVTGLALPCPRAYGESARADFKQGQNAEARQDYDAAFNDYEKAFKRNSKDMRYRIALERVRVPASSGHIQKGRKLEQAGNLQGALAEFIHASQIDPSNEAALQEIANIRLKQGQSAPVSAEEMPVPVAQAAELQTVESPVLLKPVSNEPLSLHMTEDAKVVYQTVGKAAGINVLFDPDLHSTRITVDLNNVSLLDALRMIGVMSNTFWRPVTENAIFVAQNTPAKRRELDDEAVQTFYLTNAWQQNDLNDVATAIRNVMPSAKAFPVQSQNAIVMRGTPDELLLAQQLIDNLDKARGEVVVDVGIMEVSKDWEKTLGLSMPNQFGVTLQPNCAATNTCTTTTNSTTGASTTTNPTLYNLAHLNSTNFAVSVGSATLNLLLTDNNTKILQSPRLRATDGQKADLKIGSKIPIATGSYSMPGISATAAMGYAQTQFQYQDVGVEVEMTPSIHYDRDITLKIKITVSAVSGSSTIEGVTEPIISQRVVDQVIRLRDGQASILGGIQDNQDQNNWNGIPGLSAIPILKYMFGSRDHIIQNDDIVFVIVPHIVRSQQLDQANLRVIDTGEGTTTIDLRHGSAPATPGLKPTAFMVRPAGGPSVDSMPAGSAMEAAPQMLAQLRSDMAAEGSPNAVAPQSAAATLPGHPPVAQPPVPAAKPPSAQPSARLATGASLAFRAPAAPVANGATFQVPVVLNGGTDVNSIAMQLHYDAAKLQLQGVASGDLLSRDGQPTGISHVEDPPGTVVVSISRPPGAHGVTGTGVACILTFQAKAAGATALNFTRVAVANSAQQQVPAEAGQAAVVVR